jgi:hypothetical protein
MSKVDRWYSSMPRVEINWRARETRLRLEQLGRLLVPRGAVTVSWLKRAICLFSFGRYERTQARRTQGPLSRHSLKFTRVGSKRTVRSAARWGLRSTTWCAG